MTSTHHTEVHTMKTLRTFGVLVIGCLLFPIEATSQGTITPPWVKARVFGVSPNMISENVPGIDKPSNGLPNVAKNSKVYMYTGGKPSSSTQSSESATKFVSGTFTLLARPIGSNAAIQVIDPLRVSIVPDLEGTYRIELIGTDDKGRTGGDTISINVAQYVGVGGIVGIATPPECGSCHADKATGWAKTKHATALERKLVSSVITRDYCLPCHTTGSTDPLAEGEGFLHVAKNLGWKINGVPGAGSWDSLKAVSPSLAKVSNIQCESCHGPGSDHLGNKTDNKIALTVSSEQCRQCHDAPPYHRKVDEWENSNHINSYNEPDRPEYQNRGSKTNKDSDCARCHTSNGYIDYFVKNKPYTNAPYKDVGPIGCVTCHDPHNGDNVSQLRKDIDLICADCHSVRVSGYSGLHNSHQGPMLEGTGGKEFPGYTYRTSAHTNVADKCASCHMAAPPDPIYQNKIGGHTFRVLYNNDTPADPTDDVLNSTGCVTCHASGITLNDVEETQNEIKVLLEELRQLLPQRSATDTRPKYPTDTSMTQTLRDASWNWYYVNNDLSFGVHNRKYAEDLLKASIAVIKALSVEPIDQTIPSSFALEQNYPNPFNPSTDIQFSVAKAGPVRLSVYDLSGKEIATLVNGYYQPGVYRARWFGFINDGTTAASGVYLYRLTAGTFTASKKMMLMK